MKRAYCNKCEVEIIKENKFSFSGFAVKVAEVSFSISIDDPIPGDYDVCKYCVLDAISEYDDRFKSKY